MAQLGKLMENLPLTSKPWKLKIGRELNRGAYGVVYEGTLAGQQVAVKGVHQSHLEAEGGENASRRFCDECERLKKLEHPHVISKWYTTYVADIHTCRTIDRATVRSFPVCSPYWITHVYRKGDS